MSIEAEIENTAKNSFNEKQYPGILKRAKSIALLAEFV